LKFQGVYKFSGGSSSMKHKHKAPAS
jgi:hypothetical protein